MSAVTGKVGSIGGVRDSHWREETDSTSWDRELAKLGGHPLQSALWGNARRDVDGIEDRRFIAESHAGTELMARVELRRVPFVGASVGWIPRGPTGACGDSDASVFGALRRETDCRPALIVTDRWQEELDVGVLQNRPQTVWIDLTSGRDRIWQELDKQWRYGVSKAQRLGVSVEQTRAEEDVRQFVLLTDKISREKNFEAAISPRALSHLLSGAQDAPVTAHMFVARHESAFAAAALVLRCGRSVHYMSGGTDRRFSQQRVGEMLQWSIIEWAIGEGMSLYDLEGIDRKRNPGTFAFKKKMGGREVILSGKNYHALSGLGHVVAAVDRYRDRLALTSRVAPA